MKKIVSLILIIVAFSGCASISKSSYHTGIEHLGNNRLAGVVSKSDGIESDVLINRFRHLVNNEDYDTAYSLFSNGLKTKLSLNEFKFEMNGLRDDYGSEHAFYIMESPLAQRLPLLDEAIFTDAFNYYDAVTSQYKSERNKDVGYNFSITRENGDLTICSFGYFISEDEVMVEYDAIPRKGNKDNSDFLVSSLFLVDIKIWDRHLCPHDCFLRQNGGLISKFHCRLRRQCVKLPERRNRNMQFDNAVAFNFLEQAAH